MTNIYYTLDNFPAKYTKFIFTFENKIGDTDPETWRPGAITADQVWRYVNYKSIPPIRSGKYFKWISAGSEVFAKFHHIYNKLEVFVPREYSDLTVDDWTINNDAFRFASKELKEELDFSINFSSPVSFLDIAGKLLLDGVACDTTIDEDDHREDPEDPTKEQFRFRWHIVVDSISFFDVVSDWLPYGEQFDTIKCFVPARHQILTVQWSIKEAIPIKQMYEKKDAQPFFPKTAFSAVIDESGNTLSTVIKELQEEKVRPYKNLRKINDYLYSVEFDLLDYNYASKYFLDEKIMPIGGCSAVRNGNFYGRNLDWTLDEMVEFIVRTPAAKDRFSSISVASHPELVKDLVSSMEYSDLYRILPFFVKDGINENGVVCNVNVVPNDHGDTTGTKELAPLEICATMLPRYILDHATTAEQIVSDIQEKISIYSAKSKKEMHFDVHFMIADEEKTFIVEFVDNQVKVISYNANPAIMTNFFIYGVTFNAGKVNTPYTNPGTISPGMTDYGAGLERYNLIRDNLSLLVDEPSMMDFMYNNLGYYNAYQNVSLDKMWCTEFVSQELGMTTSKSASEFLAKFVEFNVHNRWANRKRDGEFWQTVHTSVYDIENRRLYIRNQEEEGYDEIVFDFKDTYTAAEIDEMIANAGKVSHIEEGTEPGTIAVTEEGVTNQIMVHGFVPAEEILDNVPVKDIIDITTGETIVDPITGIAYITPGGGGDSLWEKIAGNVHLKEEAEITLNGGANNVEINANEVDINSTSAKVNSRDIITDEITGNLSDILVQDIDGNPKNANLVEAINALYALIQEITEIKTV